MKLYNINSSGINFQTLARSLKHFHAGRKKHVAPQHIVLGMGQ